MQHDIETPTAPADKTEQTYEQRYANLCSAIGERHYLIYKWTVEVGHLTQRLNELIAKNAEIAT